VPERTDQQIEAPISSKECQHMATKKAAKKSTKAAGGKKTAKKGK
jgi:hypothetical protein